MSSRGPIVPKNVVGWNLWEGGRTTGPKQDSVEIPDEGAHLLH